MSGEFEELIEALRDGSHAGHEQTHLILRELLHEVRSLRHLLEESMTTQDDINAAVAQLQADETGIQASLDTITQAATAIQAEIAALQAQNPALDLTGLQAAAAQLDVGAQNAASVAAVVAAIPPAPAP